MGRFFYYLGKKKINIDGAVDFISLMQKKEIVCDNIVFNLIKAHYLKYCNVDATVSFILLMQKQGIACHNGIISLIKQHCLNFDINATISFISSMKNSGIACGGVVCDLVNQGYFKLSTVVETNENKAVHQNTSDANINKK